MASWGLLHTSAIKDISHIAFEGFMALIRASSLMLFTDTQLSSCLCISWEYHILKRFLMESLSGLLIVGSIGWSLSIQFSRTTTIWILLACNICLNFSASCPLKMCQGWLGCGNFSFDLRKGITALFKYWIIDASCDQWFAVCDTSQPSGNCTSIRFTLVQNLWMHKAPC